MLQNTNEIWTVFKKETFRTFIVLKSEDNPLHLNRSLISPCFLPASEPSKNVMKQFD